MPRQPRRRGQGLHAAASRRADGDGAEAALALHVVERGQKLIVHDHARAHDEHFRRACLRRLRPRAQSFRESLFEHGDAFAESRFGESPAAEQIFTVAPP